MKKIVSLLFLASLFVACGSDDNDPTPLPLGPEYTWQGDWNDSKDPAFKPEYKEEYAPLRGEWQLIRKNGKAYTDFMVYKFLYYAWDVSTLKPADGVRPVFKNWADIGFNDKQFMDYHTKQVYLYSVRLVDKKFYLTIVDGKDTYELEYYFGTSFTWRGDWNDPQNRFYQIYQGKYNPVKGTWKLDKPTNDYRIRYSEDFIMTSSINGFPFEDPHKYEINDIGLKEAAYFSYPSDTYEYRLTKEDDVDVLYHISGPYKSRYTRVN